MKSDYLSDNPEIAALQRQADKTRKDLDNAIFFGTLTAVWTVLAVFAARGAIEVLARQRRVQYNIYPEKAMAAHTTVVENQ